MIPWRIKKWLSDHQPLIYHLLAHRRPGENSPAHWDAQLESTWDAPYRRWPTVNAIVAEQVAQDSLLLDVGCGTGSLLRELRVKGYTHIHGLELSPYATRRLLLEGISVHQGRIPKLPFPDSTFDAVVLSQVLEHVVRRNLLLSEIRRITKPGGLCLIFVPDNCQGPIDEPEHVVMFNEETLRTLLSKSFKTEEIRSFRDENHKMPYLYARCRIQ